MSSFTRTESLQVAGRGTAAEAEPEAQAAAEEEPEAPAEEEPEAEAVAEESTDEQNKEADS